MPKAPASMIEALREEGLVQASEVARALEMHLTTITRRIEAGTMPGQMRGGFWYIDVHRLLRDMQKSDSPKKLLRAVERVAAQVVKRRASHGGT